MKFEPVFQLEVLLHPSAPGIEDDDREPQRIAPEWWREIGTKASRTRDYYRIEDEGGAGYWVYREGLYGRDEEPPTWFLHGLFG